MAPLTIQQAFRSAVEHHQAGRLVEAEQLYQQILAEQPQHANAMLNLGLLTQQSGRKEAALDLIGRAVALNPSQAHAHNNLGVALKENGQRDAAIAAFRKAIAIRPDYAEAYSNLGNALVESGQLDEAIAAYRQAIAFNPSLFQALNSLANTLRKKGQLSEAIGFYRRMIAIKPDFVEAYINLGIALRANGQVDESIAACRQAVVLAPGEAEVYLNLSHALFNAGQLDEAIAAVRQAIALRPDYAKAHSILIILMNIHPAYDAAAIAEELGRWNRQHAEPLGKYISAPANDRNRERALRIGYVSPDFRNHAVGRNLLPLFKHHDRQQFNITCYASLSRPDWITSEFQQHADRWRDVAGLSDEQVAKQIRADEIDILVDLALHTAGNRLLIFARKPAPVQVTFAGYPGSTGLRTIDYRLSDPYLDPLDRDESIYSEKTIRLPDSFWCYDPLENRNICVNALPALEAGRVTFGCLNNFSKVNDDVLSLWAQVLQQVENSHLLLLAPAGSYQRHTLERLREKGIEEKRVEFQPRQSIREYLGSYHRIDIGLDSFPYNGHTTSLDSFWMGVPVITLVGETAVSRAGWCQLSNVELTELAAQTPEQFVNIAVELAKDLPRLSELRRTLRARMEQSPLMDAKKFARSIEAAYREMWHAWCDR